jgi:hypothetical protein
MLLNLVLSPHYTTVRFGGWEGSKPRCKPGDLPQAKNNIKLSGIKVLIND